MTATHISPTAENPTAELLSFLAGETRAGRVRWHYGINANVLNARFDDKDCVIAHVPEGNWRAEEITFTAGEGRDVYLNVSNDAKADSATAEALRSLWAAAYENASANNSAAWLSRLKKAAA